MAPPRNRKFPDVSDFIACHSSGPRQLWPAINWKHRVGYIMWWTTQRPDAAAVHWIRRLKRRCHCFCCCCCCCVTALMTLFWCRRDEARKHGRQPPVTDRPRRMIHRDPDVTWLAVQTSSIMSYKIYQWGFVAAMSYYSHREVMFQYS